MISGSALLRKTFYGSKCMVKVDMKVHLHLPDNWSEVAEFRPVFFGGGGRGGGPPH
jgi:hypothetical protein